MAADSDSVADGARLDHAITDADGIALLLHATVGEAAVDCEPDAS